MPDAEFAPEYTRAERLRFLAASLAAGAATVLVGRLWFFPWLGAFADSAPCRSVLGVPATTVLFHGLFVGLPLLAAGVVAALLGRRGFRILRQGRMPPAGEKVFRPTPVVSGTRARRAGYLHLVSPLPLLALAVWGRFQARSLATAAGRVPNRCLSSPSMERTIQPGLHGPSLAAPVDRRAEGLHEKRRSPVSSSARI